MKNLDPIFESEGNKNSTRLTTVDASRIPNSPPSDTCCSFALRLAGIAIMLAALTCLIYLLLMTAGFVSAIAFTTMFNSVVVAVGGLLGVSAPLAALSGTCASLGLTTTTASSLLAASVSLVTMGMGYGVFRSGKQPSVAETESSCCYHP